MTKEKPRNKTASTGALKDEFENLANASFVWREDAMSLRRAADELCIVAERDWDERRRARAPLLQGNPPLEPPNVPPLEQIIMNLTASAIETLLKAIYIERNGALNDKGEIRKELRTHILLDICKQLEIKLSDEEASLLRRMTRYIEWAGRYPVPLTPNGLQQFTFTVFNADHEIASALLDRLQKTP